MKICLSKYWNNNSIFMLVMIALIIVCTVIFCALMPDEENYVLMILVALFVALQCFLLSLSLKLVRYVAVEDNFLVMFSFAGKRLSSIDLNSKTYFKIFHFIIIVYNCNSNCQHACTKNKANYLWHQIFLFLFFSFCHLTSYPC